MTRPGLGHARGPGFDGLRRQVGPQRIIAVFEPRSNTMKLGTMKAQLPWSLEQVDLAICHSGGLDWSASEALAPMGERALVGASIDGAVRQVTAVARPGDHVLCMSNGGFGGIHDKILAALARARGLSAGDAQPRRARTALDNTSRACKESSQPRQASVMLWP